LALDRKRHYHSGLSLIRRIAVSTRDSRSTRATGCGLGKGNRSMTKRNSLSALDQIRAEINTCKDPKERVRLARRAREARGTMLEIVETLPSAADARRALKNETEPKAIVILRKYIRNLEAS